MKISVFGLGYVGCVSSACLARDGHEVIGVDVNPHKIEMLNSGASPIVEPSLEKLIYDGVASRKLQATDDSCTAIQTSEVSLICVGTPSNSNGSLDLKYIKNVCRDIGTALKDKSKYHVVVIRSTVLPNTIENILIPILEEHSGKYAHIDFGICMNPEFLREGSAINDYDQPSQIIIGTSDDYCAEVIRCIYKTIDAPIVQTTIKSAEMLKYANNAFHAFKIVFANEIGNLCKAHEVDGQHIMEILCQDRQLNISPAYLQPGFAFGGSCLPKDTRALLYRSKEFDIESPTLSAILESNRLQILRGIKMVEETGYKKIGFLGLSFKAGTDDVRESPVVPMIETLVGRGYTIAIYDEQVQLSNLMGANKFFLESEIPHIASLMCSSLQKLVAQSDVIVVTKASDEFLQLPQLMTCEQVLIDLIGLLKVEKDKLYHYQGICW